MNRLHVYMGNGKGKTTAAMGLAVRSLGHGKCVLIGQFMKDGRSGELTALAALPGAVVWPCEPLKGFVFRMSAEERAEQARRQTAYAAGLMDRIRETRPQMIILDELGVALTRGMVDDASAMKLIDLALRFGETVVTGFETPAWLLDRADYISRIEAQRHPYESQGLAAREGVEW